MIALLLIDWEYWKQAFLPSGLFLEIILRGTVV